MTLGDNRDNALELSESNPYAGGSAYFYADGTAELNRPERPFPAGVPYRLYTVRRGDFIDDIAWRHYRDLVPDAYNWWWLITDANEIENPLFLEDYEGQDIKIPDVIQYKLLAADE